MKHTASENFRRHLSVYLEKDGVSLRQVSRDAGCVHSHLLSIISGSKETTLSLAERISIAIGKSLSEMISD